MSVKQLLSDIDAFLSRSDVDITETTFGRLAVNDGKLVPRIRAGGRVWPETEERIRGFIASRASEAPRPSPPQAGVAA